MAAFVNFAEYVSANKTSLATEVVSYVVEKSNLTIPDWERDQALNMYKDLFSFLGESLARDDSDEAPEALLDWSKKNAAMQVSAGGKISEIAVRYPATRDIFIELLTDLSIEFNMTVKENASVIKRVNSMLDISLNETIVAFERLTDEYTEKTKKELAELSAPLIPVKDGIVVLPLVGQIDQYRAKYIMENVVPKIADLNVDYVIADFSGVFTINVEIAEYLYQIGEMLRLMGIHVVTTGLRPELAQTVVVSSIDVSTINTYATVKQALELLQ